MWGLWGNSGTFDCIAQIHKGSRLGIFEGLEILPGIKTISEEVGKGEMVGLHLGESRDF